MSAHLGLILHVQQGNNSPYGWFAGGSGGNGVSSTWWVSKAGAIEMYVTPDLTAYAQGAGNPTYNSVETEGFDTEPLTPAQISGVAQIYDWGMTVYGWPAQLANAPGNRGLGTHAMGGVPWGNHPGCPGALRTPQRQAILDEATQAPITQEEVMLVAFTPSGKAGYFCVTSDGAVFAYGDAVYKGGVNNAGPGGTSALPSGDVCTGLSVCAADGYLISTAQKNLYAFGSAPFIGKP
jgi:hypothetical protein